MPSRGVERGPGAALRRPRAIVIVAVAVASLLGGVLVVVAARPRAASPRAARTIVVVIPRGTAARIRRHERVDVIPERLVVDAGDRLRVVNHDVSDHTVGPFYVSAGQTMQTDLARVGRYVGTCSVHREHQLEIVVRAT